MAFQAPVAVRMLPLLFLISADALIECLYHHSRSVAFHEVNVGRPLEKSMARQSPSETYMSDHKETLNRNDSDSDSNRKRRTPLRTCLSG